MHLLCRIGLHRWVFTDVRNDDLIISWYWCQRDCPRYTKARVANIERSRVPPSSHPTAGVSSEEP